MGVEPEEKPLWILVGGRNRLGRALAERLVERCHLVLTGSRPLEDDTEGIKELSRHGKVCAWRWEAEDSDLLSRMMTDLNGLRLQGIQAASAVLVAGIFPRMPLGVWSADQLADLWRINLSFPLLAAQAISPFLRDGGSLQFILDTCIHRPYLQRLPYCASKAALAAILPGMAQLMAPRVRVVGHALGTLLPQDSEDSIALAQRSLLKTLGQPDDLVRALLFAHDSPYLTGEILTLDGGMRWMTTNPN